MDKGKEWVFFQLSLIEQDWYVYVYSTKILFWERHWNLGKAEFFKRFIQIAATKSCFE